MSTELDLTFVEKGNGIFEVRVIEFKEFSIISIEKCYVVIGKNAVCLYTDIKGFYGNRKASEIYKTKKITEKIKEYSSEEIVVKSLLPLADIIKEDK